MMIPKSSYIKVDSIEDLDLTKISTSQLGNKYVDKDGTCYALRFNKDTRKIEVIRLLLKSAKTVISEKSISDKPSKSEGQISKPKTKSLDEILAEKAIEDLKPSVIEEPIEEVENTEGGLEDDLHDFDLGISAKEETNVNSDVIIEKITEKEEKNFLAETLKEFEKNKERISAMLNNLKNSKIFDVTGDPSENKNIIGNLSREIDVEVFQGMDKIFNFYKELTTYPRPSGYYSSKYDKTRKTFLTKMSDDKEIMKFVIRWEMQDLLLPMYQKLKKLILDILAIMNTKTDSHLKQIQFKEQQMFIDAKNAAIFMSGDLDVVLNKIIAWKNEENV